MAKIKLSDLKPDQKNFNKHTEFGTSLLEKSLRKFGAGRSILIDKNNQIIAGNGITESAAALGMDDVLIVESDGKRIIAVKRTDIDLDSVEGRELALADNATSKANLNMDTVLIEEVLSEEIMKEWGIESDEKKEINEDGFEADPPINPITKLGDVYELNQHRFSCGDSCDAAVVEKTLAGSKPILMVTDPPYGVNYDPTWRHKAGINNSSRQGKVQNDEVVDWKIAYSLFGGDVAYVWHGDRHAAEVATNLEDCGFDIICQIVWNKQQMVFSRGDYHWKHEPCWYAVKKGKKHNYQGDRKQTTVWDIQSILQASKDGTEANKAVTHGTQKPIECMARPIRNNTYERESVYDPFLGSGTTIIAADQINRACYGQEIDPAYCDMIVARYIKFKQSESSGTAIRIKRNGNPNQAERQRPYPRRNSTLS